MSIPRDENPRRPLDTTLGGGGRTFPDTTWGLVSRFADGTGRDYRSGLETLCLRYWRPIYLHLRIARAKSNEDAKDLVQAFFLWLLDGEALARYDSERGSFRNYLKLLLKQFMGDHEKWVGRLKRGGGVRTLDLEDAGAHGDEVIASHSADPERAFDRAWKKQVLDHAIARVRDALARAGRTVQFRVFEEYDLQPQDARPSYEDVAVRLGLKPGDVRNHLSAVRGVLRTEIRAELAKLTTGDRALEEEWDALFGS